MIFHAIKINILYITVHVSRETESVFDKQQHNSFLSFNWKLLAFIKKHKERPIEEACVRVT